MTSRIVLPLLGLGLLLALSTCGRDEPTRPGITEIPRIVAITPGPWSILSGTVGLTVEADHAEIVSLLIDGSPVGTDDREPFRLDWNTSSFDNGAHQVTISAQNRLGASDSTEVLLVGNPGRGIAVVSRESEATVMNSASRQFSATVLGAGESGVIWVVEDSPPPLYPRGRITEDGVFTAPVHVPTPPTATILARSREDPRRFATILVHLEGISIQILPGMRSVATGQRIQLTARVFGTGNQAVVWSVEEEGSDHGSVSADGTFTAPLERPDPPRAVVRAVSAEDPTKSDIVAVNLLGPITLDIDPDSADVPAATTRQFTATLQNSNDPRVLWSIDPLHPVGSIDGNGLYRAPASLLEPAVTEVRVRSAQDTTITASAIVHVLVNETPPIPPDEAAAIVHLSRVSYRASLISDQVTDLVTRAIKAVSRGHLPPTTTGRFEESTDGIWQYASGDPGMTTLVIVPRTGPETEITVTGLTVASWPYGSSHTVSGCDFAGSIQCRVRQAGHFDLTLDVFQEMLPDQYDTVFDRTIRGTFTDLDFLDIDVHHTGKWFESNHVGSADHQLSGSATTTHGSVQLDDAFQLGFGEQCYVPGGTFNHGAIWRLRNEARFGPYTFELSADIETRVGYACQYGLVEGASNWRATGDLLRNSAIRGRLSFDGPVVERGPAPRAVLNGAVVLRNPGIPVMEEIISNPFRYF